MPPKSVLSKSVHRRPSTLSQTTPAPVTSTKRGGKASIPVKRDLEEEIEDEEDMEGGEGAEEEEEEEDSGAGMAMLLQALQSRAASKSNSHAKALQTKTATLINAARTQADRLKAEAEKYLEEALTEISHLQLSEFHTDYASVAKMFGGRTKIVHSILRQYESDATKLSSERAEIVEAASETIACFPKIRERGRRRIMKHAQKDLSVGLENQKLATDAQAYIKHYKALIRI